MKLETFFQRFDVFADLPDAAKKMRELIVELAIRGKLVSQDAGDGTAFELLDRIAANRAKAVQAGKVKKQATLLPVENGGPFQLPATWQWSRLGETGTIFNGNSVSESGKAELAKVENGLPFIATKDVGYGRASLDYDNGLSVPRNDPAFKIAHRNAVLICAEGGSAGRKIGITDRDVCFGNKLYANEVWPGISHQYVFYVYQSPSFFREFSSKMTGIIGGITRSEFLLLPIPVPPEEEQKRIVAKVEELMALCDRLEAQQENRRTQNAALVRASLARFADAPVPVNFNHLFHESFSIPTADLRKSILSLAVQGKLVCQDPNDEPADAILMRILFEGPLRKPENDPTTREAEGPLPFHLPHQWSVSQLGSLLDPTRGISYGVIKLGPEPQQGGVFILRCSNVRFRRIDLNGIRKVTEQLSSDFGRTILRGGEVLINVRGTLGGCAVVPPELKGYNIAREVAVIPVHKEIDPRFLLNVISSPYFQDRIEENLRGIAYEGLNLGLLRAFPIPIPPLAEQHRIVAKVNELMELVDTLETQLADAFTKGSVIAEAIAAELVDEV